MTMFNPNQPTPLTPDQQQLLYRAVISETRVDIDALSVQLGLTAKNTRRRIACEQARLSRWATTGPVREGTSIVYARPASYDYHCDIFCERRADGTFRIEVATERVFMPHPLPPPAPEFDARAVLARILLIERLASEAPRHPIARSCDGQVYEERTPERCLERLEWLVREGYRVPETVLEDIAAQRRNTTAPPAPSPPRPLNLKHPTANARPWNAEEERRLAKTYAHGVDAAHGELPGRTRAATVQHAYKRGHRVQIRQRMWTHAQRSFIETTARKYPRTPHELLHDHARQWHIPVRELQRAILVARAALREARQHTASIES